MVHALPELTRDDTEFDLDVRLEAVAREVSADPGQRATEVTCVECTGGKFTCDCS
jgi:hypothetical protein